MSSPVPNPPFALPSTAQGTSSAATENFLVSQIVTVCTAAALLVAGWFIFVFFAVGPTLGFKTDDKPAPQPKVTPNSTPKRPPPKVEPLPTAESPPINTAGSLQKYAGQEQLVLLRLQRAEFEFRTANLKTVISNVKQRIQTWKDRAESLADSNEGRRLAASAREVRFLLSQKPTTLTELNELLTSVTTVREKFSQTETPVADLKPYGRELADTEAKLSSVMAKFDSLETALDKLLADAKPMPNGPTLHEAFEALDAQTAKDVLLAATEQEEKLKTRFAEEIKTAKEQREKTLTEFKSAQSDWKRIEAESKQQLDEAANQRTNQLRELAQQRLAARKRMEEALPEFRERLSVFIKPGYRQPDIETHFVGTIESQPISYSALLRVGALEDDLKGLERLLIMGDTYRFSERNDRPLGAFPKYTNWEFDVKNPEIIRQLKAIQEFLRRHGEAMMDAKLLSP